MVASDIRPRWKRCAPRDVPEEPPYLHPALAILLVGVRDLFQ